MVTDAGRRIVGTDQSTGMLARARTRFPGVPLEKVGLQELAFEEVDDQELDALFAEATAQGLPVVRGEESGAGYHYCPSRDQVAAWLEEAGLQVVAQEYSPGDGYGYLHLLTRAA